ncbi:hypothetical protein D3C76_444300 [compost metagenome]
MIIIGAFMHSIELEQALFKLETIGIDRDQLLVVCMTSDFNGSNTHQAEGPNTTGVEIGIASATALSVIGVSVGFILPWGPILCGLTTVFIGFFLGFGIHAVVQRPLKRRFKKTTPEVTVIVQCHENQSQSVTEILCANHALAVGHARASVE